MAERGTIQKIADAVGVDHQTVRNALKSAELKPGRGGYDFAQAVEIVKAVADPARVAGHAVTRGGGGGSAFGDARTRFETLRAQKLEIENAKLEGKLVERADVIETLTTVIGSARTACLALGVRCAPKLVGMMDQKQIARTIETEMRRILEDLADDVAFFAQQEEDALS